MKPVEKSATEAHAQMYSPKARPAMRNETEGQTSWFFHNPEVESGAKQPGEFAPQKAAVIPDTLEKKPAVSPKQDIPAGSKFVPSSPEEYRAELNRSPRSKEFLKDSAEAMKDRKIFKLQTPEGKDTGIAYSITPKGELQGVVNNSPYSGASTLAVQHGFENGATHTEPAWDVNGRLSKIYKDSGHQNIVTEPYDIKTYGEPSTEMKDAWKKAGWKEGTPYPNFTHLEAPKPSADDYAAMASAYSSVPGGGMADKFFMFASPEEQASQSEGFQPGKWNVTEQEKVAQVSAKLAQKNSAGAVDPRTMESASKGIGVEVLPEVRQALDHVPTKEDFLKFYDQHRLIFSQNPDLRMGWDNNSTVPGGHEINIGAVGPNAARVAKKLDQRAAFNIAKGEDIPTGGTGLRTEFPNYPLEDRMKDLRGEPQSDIKGFEHISKDVYDHLEPDERDYLKGDKTIQQNVMSQYHKLQPSVNETSNAMQAGAALGGWWKRYIDIFHNLTSGETEAAASAMGPSHAEILKQWHAALSANKNIADANNLAWHTYADWLDAGKPTDRTSIDAIVRKNGAQPAGAEKRGNAAMSDTRGPRGRLITEGMDTSKLFNLVNSPEMKGERPFHNDVFSEGRRNPLMGKGEGYRKVPSMGATVAGKGNLNRIVLDSHIRDFYGQPPKGPAAQYIADSVHLRQAAKALGLKGGEGQEQLWGTVLGLKTLLKQGLTPEEAGGTLSADTIRQIGKDYAEVIANDPEITKAGGVLDRLKEKYNIGGGSAGVGEAYRKTLGTGAGSGQQTGSQAPVDPSLVGKTAGRIRGQIADVKIKKPAASKSGAISAIDLINMLSGLKKPAK